MRRTAALCWGRVRGAGRRWIARDRTVTDGPSRQTCSGEFLLCVIYCSFSIVVTCQDRDLDNFSGLDDNECRFKLVVPPGRRLRQRMRAQRGMTHPLWETLSQSGSENAVRPTETRSR